MLSLNALSLEAPRLPAVASRARRQCRIKTRMGGVRRLHLVGVGFGNTERLEGLHHARMQPLRPRRVARLPGGNGMDMGYLLGQGSGTFRLRQQGCQHLLCARGQFAVVQCFGVRRRLPLRLVGLVYRLVRGLLFGVLIGVLRRGAVRHGFHCRVAG